MNHDSLWVRFSRSNIVEPNCIDDTKILDIKTPTQCCEPNSINQNNPSSQRNLLQLSLVLLQLTPLRPLLWDLLLPNIHSSKLVCGNYWPFVNMRSSEILGSREVWISGVFSKRLAENWILLDPLFIEAESQG
jgi:hypothetical protein